MRFSLAIDSLNKENAHLRRLLTLLVVTSGILGLLSFALYDKDPIVVERSSQGLEVIRTTDFKRSDLDLKRGIEIMLKARFDTQTLAPDLYLSTTQLALRQSEQKELKSRNIIQSVVLRNVQISKTEATIDFDRVLAVGEMRSALKTKIKIAFEEVLPNELNPYGLKLAFAESLELNQTKEVKK